MEKQYLIGQSTTMFFDYSPHGKTPIFEQVPDGAIATISGDLKPHDKTIVIEDKIIQNHAERFSQHLKNMAVKINIDGIVQHSRDKLYRNLKENKHDPAEEAQIEEFVQAIYSAFGRIGIQNDTDIDPIQWDIDRELSEIFNIPLKKYSFDAHMAEVTKNKQKNIDSGNSGIKLDLPFISGFGANFVFDLYLADKLGLELVTNASTKENIESVRKLIQIIEKEDLSAYLRS